MAKLTLAVVLIFAITGCAGISFNPLNPPAVKAQAPNGCDANGVCTQHIDTAWGYCDLATYQTDHTFSGTLEIGISTTPASGNDSICGLPLASGGDITAISGNVDYRSWGKNPASMLLQLRACTQATCPFPSGQEYLMAAKYTANPGSHTVSPFTEQFASPIHTDHLMLVFNDDLQNAKPTTISVAFSGTFK